MRPICAALLVCALSAPALSAPVTDQWDFRAEFPSPAARSAALGVVPFSAGGRPSSCPQRRWCGCALALRLFGAPRPDLWRARNWLALGRRLSAPEPGAVVVFARGRNGGHVGQIVAVPAPGRIVVWSGNDGGAIRERERSTRGVIGYRML